MCSTNPCDTRGNARYAPGVTYTHTQGVVKNIIPAIPSTNAVVAAVCTLETLKMATMCSPGMNNYMLYVGTSGVYTHTVVRLPWRSRLPSPWPHRLVYAAR